MEGEVLHCPLGLEREILLEVGNVPGTGFPRTSSGGTGDIRERCSRPGEKAHLARVTSIQKQGKGKSMGSQTEVGEEDQKAE